MFRKILGDGVLMQPRNDFVGAKGAKGAKGEIIDLLSEISSADEIGYAEYYGIVEDWKDSQCLVETHPNTYRLMQVMTLIGWHSVIYFKQAFNRTRPSFLYPDLYPVIIGSHLLLPGLLISPNQSRYFLLLEEPVKSRCGLSRKGLLFSLLITTYGEDYVPPSSYSSRME